MGLLCKIEEAAAEIGVPSASLRTAAENHGFIVRMGRAIRLERDRLPELLKKCRDHPKGQGSTNSNTDRTGISETKAKPTVQRAALAASRLKKPLAHTSQPKGAQVLPMNQKTQRVAKSWQSMQKNMRQPLLPGAYRLSNGRSVTFLGRP